MDLTLLRQLTQTFGPSGYEDDIRRVIREIIAESADEVRVDALGSLVAYREGSGDRRRVLLSAHMDEIGLMVTHIEENGFLRFTSIGGLNPLNCVGARAQFADGTTGPIAVERRDDRSKTPELRHLYIDVGATGRKDCPVRIGDPAVFVGPLVQQSGHLFSKAMDDRIGCYILIEALRRLQQTPDDVFFVFSTQEEITLSGARTSAYRINPDLALSIDVTATGDTPKALPMDVAVGKGPAVKIKDAGMIAHPHVRDMLIEAAERGDIPYQLEVLTGGTTDAAVMQLTRAGVPSGCISLACRYVHTTSEMVAESDVEHAIELVLTLLQGHM